MHPVQETFASKLPHVGTNIFSVMSQMAQQHGAINLSQGFPDFPVSTELIDRIHHYMKAGFNQYAPMPGVPALREALAAKMNRQYGTALQADAHITITAGATEAIFSTITTLVNRGDEVIIIEPSYDCYAPAIALCGAKSVHIPLQFPELSVDWQKVEAAITERTKLIIVNSPHNPTGAIISAEDMQVLSDLVLRHKLWVLSDEVYEHIIFDGNEHQSVLRYPELAERSVAVYSFGKTFHATGWKVGYTVAPEVLTREIRKVHQFVTFSVNTPLQYALADYLANPKHYEALPSFYQAKRDRFLELVAPSRFKALPSSGTYFQLLSFEAISQEPDTEMAIRLTKEFGIASIPVSVFYHHPTDHHVLRFCFAKSEETLQKAAEVLCKI
ncbi:methionine aminotransferase [Cytophagales bacterium LB-30]|uniref:Methionine aminotransferase n=1 Tax=Shiella aurantiaca TaxID=3058365 RepID=A0ABT8F7H8_9BACT|nr:methionine aminotransferase [Shiella aurantiaca]MDN4166199.1 methionine aminotransferase [Shiella aurantiaca]